MGLEYISIAPTLSVLFIHTDVLCIGLESYTKASLKTLATLNHPGIEHLILPAGIDSLLRT